MVPVQSKDELGQLADAFNKLAAKLRAYRQITTDQILQALTEILFRLSRPILALFGRKINFANPAAGNFFKSST